MRILELISPSRLGGAERYVGWISREFQKRGHEVLIGLRPCVPVASFYGELELPVKEIAISGKFNPLAKSRINSLFKEFKPDIVHTHLSTASHWGLKAAKEAGICGIGHMHSFNSVGPYGNASRIIAVSGAVERHLKSEGFHNVDVVYPSSQIQSVEPADDIAAMGENVVACAARLREDKGVGVLVEAFEVVQRSFPQAWLLLCGDGPMRTRLERVSRSRRLNVFFAGYRDDMPRVFAASAVAVLPSIRPEGYGIALYEAQAAGIPVITSDLGGAVEAVGGESGIRVPAGSVDSLATAILLVLSDRDKRMSMGEAARIFAATRSISASAEGVLRSFRSCVRM